jgi:hypothetical protein
MSRTTPATATSLGAMDRKMRLMGPLFGPGMIDHYGDTH